MKRDLPLPHHVPVHAIQNLKPDTLPHTTEQLLHNNQHKKWEYRNNSQGEKKEKLNNKTTTQTSTIPRLQHLYTPTSPPPVDTATSNIQVSHDNKMCNKQQDLQRHHL